MQTLCIGCGRVIKDGPAENFNSNGVCSDCLTQAMKGIQRRQGNFECFGTAVSGDCDQLSCKYRQVCLTVSQKQTLAET